MAVVTLDGIEGLDPVQAFQFRTSSGEGLVRDGLVLNPIAHDLSGDGSEKLFNMTSAASSSGQASNIQPWQGSVAGNAVKLHIYAGSFGKDQEFAEQDCVGTFSSDCTSIDWGVAGCLKQPPRPSPSPSPRPPPKPNTVPITWCGAWAAEGCESRPPPYATSLSLSFFLTQPHFVGQNFADTAGIFKRAIRTHTMPPC